MRKTKKTTFVVGDEQNAGDIFNRFFTPDLIEVLDSQDQGLTRQNIGLRKENKEVTVLVALEAVAVFTVESAMFL